MKVFKPAVGIPDAAGGFASTTSGTPARRLLIAANVGPKVIQERMGHSWFAITYDRYGHLYPNEAEQQVSDALETAFA